MAFFDALTVESWRKQMKISDLSRYAFGICVSIALLAGCNSGVNNTVPLLNRATLQPPSNLVPSSAKARLYVSGGREIGIYKLPITAKSTPIATLKTGRGEPTGMDFDPTDRLFVANLSNSIQVFTQPIKDGDVPNFTLATGTNAYNVTLDSAGNAVVAEDKPKCQSFCLFGNIDVFTAPISKSSKVSYSLVGGYSTITAGFNRNGNLWTEIAPYCSPFRWNIMYEYSSRLHHQRTVKRFRVECQDVPQTGLAFDSAGNMYLPTDAGLQVRQAGSWRKMFTIKALVNEGYLAFDASGNLYVTTDNRKLFKFSPPFSGSSRPTVTLDLPHSPAGVAIGP
ncbi:MAG: hypothetical protein JO003_04475 [Candidatus Eremiobacteraeota bacterium]|nr:hypothetical protein [Candidatus Eremiobacteraeota bacterium]